MSEVLHLVTVWHWWKVTGVQSAPGFHMLNKHVVSEIPVNLVSIKPVFLTLHLVSKHNKFKLCSSHCTTRLGFSFTDPLCSVTTSLWLAKQHHHIYMNRKQNQSELPFKVDLLWIAPASNFLFILICLCHKLLVLHSLIDSKQNIFFSQCASAGIQFASVCCFASLCSLVYSHFVSH